MPASDCHLARPLIHIAIPTPTPPRCSLGKRVTIGSCSAVLPGAVLEDGCVLGDMSLVMKNDTVPAGSGACGGSSCAALGCSEPWAVWAMSQAAQATGSWRTAIAAAAAAANPDLVRCTGSDLHPPSPSHRCSPAVWAGIPAVPIGTTKNGSDKLSDSCKLSDSAKTASEVLSDS